MKIGTQVFTHNGARVVTCGIGGADFMVIDSNGCDIWSTNDAAQAQSLCRGLGATGLTLRAYAEALAAERYHATRDMYSALFAVCPKVFICDRFMAAGRRLAKEVAQVS